MTVIDDEGRPEPPIAGDEVATLLGFLDLQRATLAWKTAGLDAAGMRATVGVSTMTLGGMLKHLARVEDIWFSQRLHGRAATPPWDGVAWAWEWAAAAEDTPEQLQQEWRDAVDRSRALVAEALSGGGLDQLARQGWEDGQRPSLRWVLVHMVEEYARHNGHVDLLREAVDGLTGE